MKSKTTSELMDTAADLEARMMVKDREYAAALMEGKPTDDLLTQTVKLRAEVEGMRRAVIEAKKLEAAEAEKAKIEEIRAALIEHKNYSAKAAQKKAEGVKAVTAGVTLLTEARQLAQAAENVKYRHELAVPHNRSLAVYQVELLHLQTVLRRSKADLTGEELQLLDALEKFT